MARTAKGWNLEQMFNSKTRPKIYRQPKGPRSKLGCNSYVYEVKNTQNDKKYIGYHKEGNQLYGTSSTNKEFKELLASNQKEILDLTILYWGSVQECKQKEFELLTSVNAKSNPNYYNKHNGHPGLRELNIGLVNTMMKEADDIRKHTNLIPEDKLEYISKDNVVEISIKDLWNIEKWQVRKLEIDTDNLNKIIDRIKNRIGNYDMPVILENVTSDGKFYEKMLISGNHTRTAFWKTRNKNVGHTENTKLKCIVIGEEIHSLLQETEIQMLGNNLNSDYNVGKAFSSADAVDECIEHYKRGHSWQTVDMRTRFQLMGLTSGQVDTVFSKVEDKIKKMELEDSGYMIYDYTDTHSDKLNKKAKRLSTDDTFVITCASGAPTLDRWMDKYITEQLLRKDKGLSIQSKIHILVYHTSFKNRDNWRDLFERLTRPQHIENDSHYKAINKLYKLPTFSESSMPMTTLKKS